MSPARGAGSGERMGGVGSMAAACPPHGAGRSALRPVQAGPSHPQDRGRECWAQMTLSHRSWYDTTAKRDTGSTASGDNPTFYCENLKSSGPENPKESERRRRRQRQAGVNDTELGHRGPARFVPEFVLELARTQGVRQRHQTCVKGRNFW